MDLSKQRKFNERMGRKSLARGGMIKRKNYDAGGTVTTALGGAATGAALGSVIPGIGNAVGAIAGGLGGLLSGLFNGSGGPQMPNIVDPVTGQQITDANGTVVASQQQLQQFAGTLQGQFGVQNQQAVMTQLQGIANGTGPNPAKAELAQATGANVANQAALMAGQRGAASNVGLIAREAAQQDAAVQQSAAGQGATLQANQSLNALNSEGQIAGQQVGETQTALGQANTAATNNQGQILGAETGYNSAITAGQGNVNSSNITGQGQVLGALRPIVQGAASGAGGQTVNNNLPQTSIQPGQTGLNMPTMGSQFGSGASAPTLESKGGVIHKNPPMTGKHKSHVANFLMSEGGKVPAMVSPKEIYLSPEKVKRVLDGADPLKIGDRFQGKAKVKGDSRKNDTIPTTLEEGGVVIPRTHAKDPDKAALFVHKAVHMKRSNQ